MVGRLMFLVDTNVWLELLLSQQKAGEVRKLLGGRQASDFAITEFSVYSIGIILTRLKKDAAFLDFLMDTLVCRPRISMRKFGNVILSEAKDPCI